MYSALFIFYVLACLEPQPQEPIREASDPLIEIGRRTVQKQLGLSNKKASTLEVSVMGNRKIIGVRDPNSQLCFALTKEDAWSVSHTGTNLPPYWSPKGYGATMAHGVDLDNISNWFNESCRLDSSKP